MAKLNFGGVEENVVTREEFPLEKAQEVLKNIPGIGFTHFQTSDVVRHPIVQTIVEAYENHEKKHLK